MVWGQPDAYTVYQTVAILEPFLSLYHRQESFKSQNTGIPSLYSITQLMMCIYCQPNEYSLMVLNFWDDAEGSVEFWGRWSEISLKSKS